MHTTILTLSISLVALATLPAYGQDETPDTPPAKKISFTGTGRILKPGAKASDPVPTTPPLAGPKVNPAKEQPEPTDPTMTERPPAAIAARHLGHRAAAVRLTQRVIPTVVLVENPSSFAQAIASWNKETRFPVLFDDGSVQAAEHIARFVHAFNPDTVTRFNSNEPWPDDRRAREQRIYQARSQSLAITPRTGQHHDEALLDWLTQIQYDPTGVVVTDSSDPAWPAALALSAARFQPIIFTPVGNTSPSGGMSAKRATALDTLIQGAIKPLGVEWLGLGQGIDAVTLVGGFPVRVNAGEDDYRALTDRIGRTSGDTGSDGSLTDPNPRWAWCGQIFGDAPAATYAAMCSIFLETDSVWAFNGYDPGSAVPYDTTTAAELLEEHMGFTTTTFDSDTNDLEHWRAAASNAGIDAGLVLVNTHGNAPEFNLPNKQRGYAGDTPTLRRPTIVHYIHSFSMQRPDQLSTIGGRWLNHGAYAYVGSMHEPYLEAFATPTTLAARLAEGWALAAAARTDRLGWWRITIHGDPLITLGPGGQRTDDQLPLPRTISLVDSMRSALNKEDYHHAVRDLVMLGRDDDAARLVSGLLNDKPDKLSRETAAAGLGAVFREKHFDRVLKLWAFVGPQAINTPALSDTLWGAARMRVQSTDRARTIALLKNNLRPDQPAADAVEISQWIITDSGSGIAKAYLRSVEPRMRADRRSKRIIANAIRALD